MQKKILLLGSGELGKEFVIAAQRLGQYVVAADSYAGAPAMQVAHESMVFSMLDGAALDAAVEAVKPDIIVPEIEAIRTERFFEYEARGLHVVPSARAANFTMNRRAIRDLAAVDLGLKTAGYRYASSLEELYTAVEAVGLPCVVKPLMSSSGKGQSTVRTHGDIALAWEEASSKGRGDEGTVIVEEFISFHTEITLLTVTQHSGQTLFCAPIGHRQERGDYRESWQPAPVEAWQLHEMQRMAADVTRALGGAGLWGVEFFLSDDAVYFSELSPRPHDTGMVTLAGTQPLNEFELHLRAVLGLPIPEMQLLRSAASAVVLADGYSETPAVLGVDKALTHADVDVRVFGKPTARPYRRMAVAVAWDVPEADIKSVRNRAVAAAGEIAVVL